MSNSTSTSDSNDLYPYDPSKIGTLIAAGVFGLTAFVHLIMMFGKRTWFYTAMVTGAFSPSLFPSSYPTNDLSDDLRLRNAVPLREKARQPPALRHPNSPHPPSAVVVCSNNLHDLRPYCAPCQRTRGLSHRPWEGN